MVKKSLALISNEHLSKFIINSGEDNALTFTMRVGNFNVFKFLLAKGVSVLTLNDNGKTAVHFAIEFGKIEYLAYLFEGETNGAASWELIQSENAEGIDPEYFSKLSHKQHIWQSL